jgi:hypothetical protein
MRAIVTERVAQRPTRQDTTQTMEALSLREFDEHWHRLWFMLASTVAFAADKGSRNPFDDLSNVPNDPNNPDDPFDCSTLMVPPTRDLVDAIVADRVGQWRAFDDRQSGKDTPTANSTTATSLINAATSASNSNTQVRGKPTTKRRLSCEPNVTEYYPLQKKRYHERDNIHLQPSDDEREQLLSNSSDESSSLQSSPRERFVCNAHSNAEMYDRELERIFHSIPKLEMIEASVSMNLRLPHMTALHQKMSLAYQQGPHGLVKFPNLVQLRYNNRHHLPPPPSPRSFRTWLQSLHNPLLHGTKSPLIPTIRFECWKRQLKRGFSPDPARMIVEYDAPSMLIHFHRLIAELHRDELWERHVETAKTCDDVDSGFFFLEGVFYTVGNVDYTSTIQQWLRSGDEKRRKNRLAFLGLSSQELSIRTMHDMCIGDLRLRLGTRYLHVCHGDVETTLFVTDRCISRPAILPYPILHDVWTQPFPTPECDTCQHRSSVYVSSHVFEESVGATNLCERCCRKLQIPPEHLELYRLWRGEADLSLGICKESAF